MIMTIQREADNIQKTSVNQNYISQISVQKTALKAETVQNQRTIPEIFFNMFLKIKRIYGS